MMCYAVLMFILVCSHATFSSAVNSQEKTLLQHGEHITTNLYEEIQDAEEWLTSVNEARTLQSIAGEKKAIPAEPLKPGYKIQAIPLIPVTEEETLRASDEKKKTYPPSTPQAPGYKQAQAILPIPITEEEALEASDEKRKTYPPATPLRPGHKVCLHCHCKLYRLLKPVNGHPTLMEEETRKILDDKKKTYRPSTPQAPGYKQAQAILPIPITEEEALEASDEKRKTYPPATPLRPGHKIQPILPISVTEEETLEASDEKRKTYPPSKPLAPGQKKIQVVKDASIRVNGNEQVQNPGVGKEKKVPAKGLKPDHKKIQEVNGTSVKSDWTLDPKQASITFNEDEQIPLIF
ncbi:adhesive plaque matrix protein-like isoform X1 [Stylophora pistillata]|uniref:adhesive plaque matrix protein-like isoform X1 n=1 Tax=Stylophora pistillata TaxID=50429 RepID=UPI000C050715|nr:adhesive plaque matrix protein-like isoform X1 [Stylophora pistillata]